MAAQGQNQGFHVLDEFVCEAIHDPSVPLASPAKQGRNERMSVVEELLFEVGPGPAAEGPVDSQVQRPAALNDAIQSEAKRLAALIAASADPLGAVKLVQTILLAELSSRENTSAAAREIPHTAAHGPGPGGEMKS